MNNKKSKRHMGRKAITVAFFSVIGMVIGSLDAAVVTVTWNAPTTVRVGDPIFVSAYYDPTLINLTVTVDGSASSGSVQGVVSSGSTYYIAREPGTVQFRAFDEQKRTYVATRTVTITESRVLSFIEITLSSSKAQPGDQVRCSMSAYSTQGEHMNVSGTVSWSVKGIVGDKISSSGIVTIASTQVSRSVSVTCVFAYNGVTRSRTETINVIRLPAPLDNIILSTPASTISPGVQLPISVVANLVDGSSTTEGSAVWSVLTDGFGDSVSRDGIVSICCTNVSRVVRVACDYTYGGCTKTAMIELPVISRCDTPMISPDSGTVFDSSLSVSVSCGSEGSIIHYTTDGSDPTVESPVYKKFKINGKTTIKAVAFNEDGNHSDVAVASYALGRCADPIVEPKDGMVFKHSGQIVTIDKNGEEGVLRYTIDGTEPTAESPVYEGPFTVDDSTVVKAKVFGDRYFDSAVVTVNLTREWEAVATPVITAAAEFTGSETKVVIACGTPEATIFYTTDGSEPTSESLQYTGPFWMDESCTVKVVAMCADYLTSEVASRTITKVWGIGDTMGAPDHAFATSGDVGFTRVEDVTAPKGEAMRSGAIGDSAGYGLYSRSVLSTTVHGPCTLKFKWRCSCEEDDGFEWDHAEFAVDGEVKARINGIMDGWAEFTQIITEGGAHAVTWTYLKDNSEKDGADCLRVADYSWTPTELYTHESSVPVPYDWIRTYLPHTAYEYDHFEAAVRETAANGVNTVEEAYVAGLNPADETSRFTAIITMEDGAPKITWTPDLSDDAQPRSYTTYGKATLEDAEDWQIVTETNKSALRFFKVTVDVP